MLDPAQLYDVLDATWPGAEFHHLGPWTLRLGQGGGKRVSSATTTRPVTEAEIDAAEDGMRNLGQAPLFMIRQGQTALDDQLQARGYNVIDPVVAYAIPTAQLTTEPMPRVKAIAVWEPLAIMREIWAAGGIGPARVEVMHRVKGPKTGLIGRSGDKPAGTAFVAIHDGVAMMHAVEVVPFQRRKGVAQWFMRGAAFWAQEHGADTLAVVCTKENIGANALYSSLGMTPVGEYHYRLHPTEKDPT